MWGKYPPGRKLPSDRIFDQHMVKPLEDFLFDPGIQPIQLMVHQHIVDAVEAEIQQARHHRFCPFLEEKFFQIVVAER